MSGSFFAELKRRNVFRVAVIYIVVSWLLMQIGDVMFPALRLPEWTPTLLAALLILGMPIALIFAWAFEITPEGVLRTEDVPAEYSITQQTGQKINHAIIGVLAVTVVFLLIKPWFADDSTPPPSADTGEYGPSIAVLPFKNQSAAEENAEFFSGGVHDELLTLLSKLGEIKVISRTSVERLDPNMTVPEIGKFFAVATVLEGQVQRAGDRLRINVQLIDAATEDHVWANTYDRELTASNVFEVQSDIARIISTALHAELSPEAEELLAEVPTTNTEALENYLLGVQKAKLSTFEALQQAAGYLSKAVELDPEYADAWAELAYVANRQLGTGAIDTATYRDVAEPAIRNALSINPRLALAHAQQAFMQAQLGDLEGTEQSFQQALDLSPNDSRILHSYGFHLRTSLRASEAIPYLEKALAIDPLSTTVRFELGKATMHSGNPERTIELAARNREIDPSVVYGYTGAMQAYMWMGQIDKAMPWFLKTLEFDELDYETWAHAALHFDELGMPEASDRYMQRAEELSANAPAVVKCRVILHSARGEDAEALRLSRKALADELDFRWGSDIIFLGVVVDEAVRTGELQPAFDALLGLVPHILDDGIELDLWDMPFVAFAARLLQEAGEDERAKPLVSQAIATYEEINPEHIHGYDLGIADVELLALDGQHDLALHYLHAALDEGWLFDAEHMLSSSTLDAIRDRTEFKEAEARVAARLAEQAANLAAMPDMGKNDLR